MATGDNTLTAISVARDCNIIDSNEETFYGEVIEDFLVWNSSKVLNEDLRGTIASNRAMSAIEENLAKVDDNTKDVPWDDESI
jgi:magnesium-transporting ATPase (P-type)